MLRACGALGVEAQRDRPLVGLRIELRLGVGDLGALDERRVAAGTWRCRRGRRSPATDPGRRARRPRSSRAACSPGAGRASGSPSSFSSAWTGISGCSTVGVALGEGEALGLALGGGGTRLPARETRGRRASALVIVAVGVGFGVSRRALGRLLARLGVRDRRPGGTDGLDGPERQLRGAARPARRGGPGARGPGRTR